MVPELTDGVVALDAHTLADVEAHLAGEDEETARRLGRGPREAAEATVRASVGRSDRDSAASGQTRTFAARQAEDGQVVGGCELRLHSDRTAEVSYWTSASRRGQGYATRALILLLDYAQSIGVAVAVADIAVDNLASRHVAARAGLREVSTFTGSDGTAMIRFQVSLGSVTPDDTLADSGE